MEQIFEIEDVYAREEILKLKNKTGGVEHVFLSEQEYAALEEPQEGVLYLTYEQTEPEFSATVSEDGTTLILTGEVSVSEDGTTLILPSGEIEDNKLIL